MCFVSPVRLVPLCFWGSVLLLGRSSASVLDASCVAVLARGPVHDAVRRTIYVDGRAFDYHVSFGLARRDFARL